MRGRDKLLGLASLMTCLALPGAAHAGGFDYTAPGTRALGRGGAFFARADDPMALLYNPANLSILSGAQLSLNAHVAFYSACADRSGRARDNINVEDVSRFGNTEVDPWPDRDLPEVCNEGPPAPSPDLIFTLRLTPELGIGAGVFTPTAIGHTVWGDMDTLATADGSMPLPTRYALLEEQLLIFYPTIGAGYSPVPWLRFGAALQWGIGLFYFDTMTVPAAAGEHPAQDIESKLNVNDLFIPAAVVSVAFVPHDNLDIMLGFRWVDAIRAGGRVELNSGVYGNGQPMSTNPTSVEYSGVSFEAPQPWQASLGVRYADRISARPRDHASVERLSGRVEDSMANERWDVELDAVYEVGSLVDEFVIDLPAGLVPVDFVDSGVTDFPLPSQIRLPHHWKDQLSLRLGGDWNVMPGMFALRLGASFETRGIDPKYAQIDFLPAMRIGVHAGFTLRLGRWDLSFAYAHLFQETIDVPASEAGLPQICAGCTRGEGAIINAGSYTAGFDIFSLAATWHL